MMERRPYRVLIRHQRGRQWREIHDMLNLTEKEAQWNVDNRQVELIVLPYPGQKIIMEVLDVPIRTRRWAVDALPDAD